MYTQVCSEAGAACVTLQGRAGLSVRTGLGAGVQEVVTSETLPGSREAAGGDQGPAEPRTLWVTSPDD